MSKVSIYRNIKDTASNYTIELDDFLANVRDMKWQDNLLPLWNCKTKEDRNKIKANLPNCTVSGTFKARKAAELIEHSGFIAIDFDDVTSEEIKPLLKDKYTYALHKSCSHTGYVCYVKIDKKRHLESFEQLAQYYHTEYQLTADPACKDVSRTRYVSADPDLYHFPNAAKFIPEKREAPKDKPRINTPYIATDDDVDAVIQELCNRAIDITSDYSTWISIAFALRDHYGEVEGLNRFIGLSQYHPTYDYEKTVRKWENICKAKGKGRATVATIFWHAKQNGIIIKSERTRQIEQAAKIAKKQGVKVNDLDRHLVEGLGLKGLSEREKELIEQLPDNFAGSEKESKENTIAEARAWMNFNLKLWRCDIRQTFFDGKRIIDDEYVNEIWERMNLAGIKIGKDAVFNLLTSGTIKTINPVRNWFEKKQDSGNNEIERLMSCIKTKHQELDEELILRWMLSVVATAFGRPVPQMLVLTGNQRTGKTSFFRNLLPPELAEFYGESTLERGKDDEMLMCQKLIIVNDEYKGQTMKEAAKLKDLLSKFTFTLRAPYGRTNKDYKRCATLAGTSNEKEVIFDYTGNRRIFPVELIAPIDFDIYNSVDKDALWRQIYTLWKNGVEAEIPYDTWQLLEAKSEEYREVDEVELWCIKYLRKDIDGFVPTLEILQKAQGSFRNQVSAVKFGRVLQKLGFVKTRSSNPPREFGYKLSVLL